MNKKLISLLLSSIIAIVPFTSVVTSNSTLAYADEVSSASNSIDSEISKEISKTSSLLSLRDSLGEWQVPSMVRLEKITNSQKQNIFNSINARIDAKYENSYSSQMAKDIFMLTALNENPQTYRNFDLINEMISKKDYIGSSNYEVWILIATELNNYSISDENKVLLNNMVEDILNCQSDNGGFGYSVDKQCIDVDMTGMAIFALSSYENKTPEITNAIENAKNYILSELEKSGGKFDNSNTTAMAILGLSSVGYDCADLASNLLTYELEDGSFVWQKTDAESNDLSTEQALYSLIQYSASKLNKNIFDFRDKWTYSELLNNLNFGEDPATTTPSEDPGTSTPTTTTPTATTSTSTPGTSTPTSDGARVAFLLSLLLGSTLISKKSLRRNIND